MEKNILIITDSYPPEIRSAAQLMRDLAEGLREKGHLVWVATSYPQYNLAISKEIAWPEITEENSVKILRIKTLPHHKVNFVIRGLAQLIMPHLFFLKIKKRIKGRIDVVIVHSPPLPLALVAIKIKKFYGAKYILNLHDIFPQNAIDLGILKNKFLIKFFEKVEKNVYQWADLIVVPSYQHKNFLEEKRLISPQKIEVIYHWIDSQLFLKTKKTGRFRELYGLANKFIFLFGGVMGPAQGLDLLIKIAAKLKDNKEITFLLIGDGTAKKDLMKMADERGLENILFREFVSPKDYSELVKDCDVGIVCLSSRNTTPAVPAKILDYLAAAIPVVAFLHKESEGFSIIREAKCGYAALSNNEEEAFQIILRIYNEKEKLKEYGNNGLKYLLSKMEKRVCVDKFEKLI